MPDSHAEEPLGYILLGVFISLWLCGILSFQTLSFFTNYPNERRWLKAFVGILVAIDGVQSLMGVGIIWHILIKNFNNLDAAQKSTRTFQMYPVLIGLISGSVQVFFVWRIKVLYMSTMLFALTAVLAIPQFVGGIAYTVLTIKVGRFTDFSGFVGVIVGWVASSVVCDLVITSTLTVILRRHHANRDLGEAAHLIHRVKIMSIHNGLVTIIWSLALLIALGVAKNGAYYIFFYPLGKVYLITMLASLNSRPVVRPELDPRIQSVLQRCSTPRTPIPTTLHLSRESIEDVEKLGRPISRASNNSRIASRVVEYLPVTQEEDEDMPRTYENDKRPSDDCIVEVQPLVERPPPTMPPCPPRSPGSTSSRPRGPRLPTAPCSAARSVSV